jgi:hypothetical protein
MGDVRQCAHNGADRLEGSGVMAFEMSVRAATPLQATRLEMGWEGGPSCPRATARSCGAGRDHRDRDEPQDDAVQVGERP